MPANRKASGRGNNHSAPRHCTHVLAAIAVWITTSSGGAGAQGVTVRGTVSDSLGVVIPDVELRLHDLDLVTRSDSAGRFRFRPVRAAVYLITARRLGFFPVTWSFAAHDTVDLAIVMYRSAITLPRVVINGESRRLPAKLLGFTERFRTSGAPRSSFITREDIDRRNPWRTSDLIRDRGKRAAECLRGMIYLDGVMMSQQSSFDPPAGKRRTVPDSRTAIDVIPPADVEAIEIYRGPGSIPSEFNATGPAGTPPGCVILVWTR